MPGSAERVAVFQADEQGHLLSVCEEWKALVGVELGQPWTEIVSPAHRERIVSEWRAARAAGRSYDTSVPCVLERAGERRMRVAAQPARNVEGLVRYLGSVVPDVRADLEEADAFRTAADAMLVVARRGEIVLANDRAAELFGYSRNELVGASVELLLPEALREAHAAHRRRFERDPHVRPMGTRSFAAKTKGGQLIPVEIRLAPQHAGDRFCVTAMVRDMREREHRDVESLLHQRLRATDLLTASLMHEVNNPLTVILSNLDLIEQRLAEGQRDVDQSLGDAREATLRIGELLRELEAFTTSPERGAVAVNPNEVLERALRLTGPATSTVVGVQRDLRSATPALANPVLLGQVFVNLLCNAVDAMEHLPQPQRRLEVRTWDAGETVCCEVSDGGPGIEPEVLLRIFELHFTTKGAGHSGVGLALSRQVVERWGGTLKVMDRPEWGATFRVELAASV